MPELPEVETVRRDLDRLLRGRQIAHVAVLLPRTVAYPDPALFSQLLMGSSFVGWDRRGKYLLAQLEGGSRLGVHLRMTGQLLVMPRAEPLSRHTRVVFELVDVLGQDPQDLRFVDQRTFGQMWGIPAAVATEAAIPTLATLGPEPFEADFSVTYLQTALARSVRPIKNALLDQTLVAGVGNIYADEALFLSGIHPLSPSKWLTPSQVSQLRQNVVEVLQASISQRGTTFSNYRDPQGINGNYQGQAWVYGRAGQPCRRCGSEIQRLKLAGRSAHFCLVCQAATSSE